MFPNRIPTAFKSIYSFSNSKKYIPLRPLTERRNLIFVDERYKKSGKLKKKFPTFTYFLPAALIVVNNFFMGWGFLTTGCFLGTIFVGAFLNVNINTALSRTVLSLEVSPDLEKFHIAVVVSGVNSLLDRNRFNLDDMERKVAENYNEGYNPLKQIAPDIQEGRASLEQKYYMSVLKTTVRKQQIKEIRFMFNDDKRQQQWKKDRVNLTPEEIVKKYENTIVQINLTRNGNQFSFIVLPQKNAEKNYHDYLVSLAAGFEIQETRTQQKGIEDKKKND